MIEIEPNNFVIEPFSKTPLTLVCLYPITHEINSKVNSFAKREDSSRKAFEQAISVLKMNDNEIQ